MDAHHHSYQALSMKRKSHYLARRANDTSPTIIISVAAAIGGLLALFILWRVILHRRQRGFANPLPPVQPLAHIREHQLTAFSAEPKIDNFRSLHARTRSNTSLLQTGSSTWNADTSPDVSVSSSLNHEPLTVPDDRILPIPQPPYFPPPASAHGPGHRRDNSVSSTFPSNDYGSLSAPAASVSNSSSCRSLPRSNSRPRSRIGAASRSTYSVVSSVSDVSGQASRSRSSGLPHVHGNFQIVLPKPLAPELYPYDSVSDAVGPGLPNNLGMRRSVLIPEANTASSSRALSDRWLSVGNLDSVASMQTATGEPQFRRNRQRTRSRSGEPEILLQSFVYSLTSLRPTVPINKSAGNNLSVAAPQTQRRSPSSPPMSRSHHDILPNLPIPGPNILPQLQTYADSYMAPVPPVPSSAYSRDQLPPDSLHEKEMAFPPPLPSKTNLKHLGMVDERMVSNAEKLYVNVEGH